MTARLRLLATVMLATGALAPAEASETLTPWQFFREMMHAAPTVRLPRAKEKVDAPAFREAGPPDETETAAGVPLPRPRPHRDGETIPVTAETGTPASPAPVVAEPETIRLGPPGADRASVFPLPVPRPKPGPGESPALAMFPTDDPAPSAEPGKGESCVAALRLRGFAVSGLAPIDEGRCTVESPVAISALPGGVDLSTKAIVNCDVASHVGDWLAETVQPAAAKLGGRVTGLRVAASYDCRGRNRIKDAKLSEHGHGNAIDISAFEIDGKRWIEVGPGWGKGDDGAFLAAVRGEACGTFTTVLGPGSDPYHSDHIHLDRAARRTAGPSKGLYCK